MCSRIDGTMNRKRDEEKKARDSFAGRDCDGAWMCVNECACETRCFMVIGGTSDG